MASNLDNLASNLEDDQCKNFVGFYTRDEVFNLMRCKGVFPYKQMDSWEKFEETKLLVKNSFYSKLNMEGISDQGYGHI